MSFIRQKQQIMILAAVIAAQHKLAVAAGATAHEAIQEAPEESSSNSESFRLGFALSSPRKYATRFLAETRTLQIRITPARAEEFQDTQYYDGRFIHRVVVKEVDGEIFLNLQLKNRNLNWIVTHQEAPWRIIVDLWQNQDALKGTHPDWNWSGYLTHEPKNAEASGSSQTDAIYLQAKQVARTPSQQENNDIDLPTTQENATEDKTAAVKRAPAQIKDSSDEEEYNPREIQRRFIITENLGDLSSGGSAPLEKAKILFRSGKHAEALNEYRREATLRQQEFRAHPESLWLAGESALQAGRTEVAKDYFLTLVASNPENSYANYARLRLLDIEYSATDPQSETKNKAQDTQPSDQTQFKKRYLELARSENSSNVVRAMAALRYQNLGSSNQKQADALPPELLANFTDCTNEPSLVKSVRNECAYEILLANLKTDDMVSAQSTIKDYEAKWPKDKRTLRHKDELSQRIRSFAESIKTPADMKNWLQFEKASSPSWISFTEKVPALLKMRAMAWESEGNNDKALRNYQKAAEAELDKKAQMLLLAKSAYLAAKQKKQNILNSSLQKIQALPERAQSGLGAEEYSYIKELALPPFNNPLALKLFLDDVFKGFHAETDIRTIVSLTEKISGSREADILFEKLLTVPAKSSAEAELKEDALMNYAETLRNQGRLVKSADMFLAVANLDNGKNRAEAAYKAGVVFFRAGLLEKATASWNMAASDLENSKYSALATERLNRIR